MGKRVLFLMVILLTTCATPAEATPFWQRHHPPEKPQWERPPPRADWQRHLQRWQHFSPQRRAQILNRAQRFQRLPPAAKKRLWEEYQQSHRINH
ncbi:DUF3106 domain-containing protein [Acidithiobacillus sp. IBUN Pt1247-S3]|uniref:DUF3106 domain-containing protein n=1 Tax=Acidithiobacillus sp. IBUN Pt1247-S3 TaxID=3166642 RepID=UPI0034E45025